MPSDSPSIRPDRHAREAEALRANLRRRKTQARARDDEGAAIEDVLTFWFLEPGAPGYGEMREAWFKRSDAFDAEIMARFATQVDAAASGALDGWAASARGALALLIVLDQFPRNMFRGQARAFATDARARDVARRALDAGFDAALTPIERVFMYLPFEHSETLADQHRAVALYEALPPAPWRGETVKFAHRHLAAIERFGRFPARNAALGRASTPEEIEFLRANPLGF